MILLAAFAGFGAGVGVGAVYMAWALGHFDSPYDDRVPAEDQ